MYAGQALKLGAQDYLLKGNVDEPGMIRAVRYAFEVRQESARF
jgi:YesN/AraC family two-component response regulator